MAPSKAITVSDLIADAAEKIQKKNTLTQEVAAARDLLRGLDGMGQTTPDESEWIAKAFPAKETAKMLRERAVAAGIEVPEGASAEEIRTLLGESNGGGE